MPAMTTYFVSRHEGAVRWAQQQGLSVDSVVPHLDPAVVHAGDTVIGTLPVHLAAQVCHAGARYVHLRLDVPAELRGRELDAAGLDRHHASLQQFDVRAASPAGGRILVVPRALWSDLPADGAWPVSDLCRLAGGRWLPRADVEHDSQWLQPIAYLLIHDGAGALWCYQRRGGDARLDGRWSCGVGGHVDEADCTVQQALLREVHEELGIDPAQALRGLQLRGMVHEGHSAAGRVHLGVVYSALWCGDAPPQPVAGEALAAKGFVTAASVARDSRFERWSQLAAHLLAQAQA